MNIFIQEFKISVVSALYWTAAMTLFILFFMLMYPPIAAQAQVMENLLNNFPLEIRRALGITTMNLSELLGFYGFIFIYVLLIGSVYAMKAGLSGLSEEIRSGSVDFLLAKPVSRLAVATAKTSSLLTNILIQNLLFLTAAFFIVGAYQDSSFDKSVFLQVNLSLIQSQLFFAALGAFTAVIAHKIKSPLPIALAIVFIFYILQMLNDALGDGKLLYISPFAYFSTPRIIEQGIIEWHFVLLNLLISTIFISLSFYLYQRKDFPA